jgi:hypothetical protein
VGGPFRNARIDVRAGSIGGVGLRDTRSALVARFGRGRRLDEDARLVPEPVPAPATFPYVGPERAYTGAVFALSRSGRVAGFVVYARGARTTDGVGVGNPLGRVRRRYPRATCSEEADSESGAIPAECYFKLRPGSYIDFIADESDGPIRSIAVSSEPFPGGCEDGAGFPDPREVTRCRAEARTGRGAR